MNTETKRIDMRKEVRLIDLEKIATDLNKEQTLRDRYYHSIPFASVRYSDGRLDIYTRILSGEYNA